MNTSKYKEILETEFLSLTNSLQELGVQNPQTEGDWTERTNDLDIVSADLNDVADRTEEYDSRRAGVATLESRWNDVKAALDKIESGTYGVCEISGDQIEEDRLEANPAARTCKAHMNENII